MSISNTHCKNKHRCNVSPFPEEAGGNLLGVTFYSHRENLFPEPVSRWKSPVHMNKKKSWTGPIYAYFLYWSAQAAITKYHRLGV